MARPLYSARFMAVQLGDSSTAEYNTPDGTISVIRDVTIAMNGGAGYPTSFQLDIDGGPIMLLWPLPYSWAGTRHWQGRQVLLPGEALTARVHTDPIFGTCGVWISGYVLSD